MKPEIKQRIKQIKNGEIPEGFKETKTGVIPTSWKYEKLDSYLIQHHEVSTQNNQYPVLTSSRKGIFFQKQYYDKEVASEDNTGYNVVPRGYFTYRHMSDDEVFVFNINTICDKGIVSTLYPVFSVTTNINPFFLQEMLNNGSDFHRYARIQKQGGSRTYMYFNKLTKLSIPIPSLDEQNRIMEILSSQDKVIECYEKKIEQLKRMKKYYLQSMFPKRGETVPKIRFKGFTDPWEHKKLGDITASYSGGTPTAGKSEYYEGAIPFIRSGEIGKDHTELFISEIGLKNSSAAMVNIGDILYALYGATSGEVSRSKIKGAINQAILAIMPNRGYDPEYLMQWLRMKKEPIINAFLQGGQGNLSGTIVKGLTVDIPCYDEQVSIGQYFSYIDNLITLHQRKLEEEKKKKKALQQLLLTGIVRA